MTSIELPPLDPALGAHPLFVSVARAEVLYFKVLIESFEGVACYRTQDPEHRPGRALIAVLVAPDFAADAAAIIGEAAASADIEQHTPEPADLIALYAALEPNDER
jgi:hypothetical protein